MNPKLREKIMESLAAVLPITAIVLLISVFLVPIELGSIVMFITGAAMLIIGMGLFQLGAETAMTPLGEGIGVQIAKTKTLPLVLMIGFLAMEASCPCHLVSIWFAVGALGAIIVALTGGGLAFQVTVFLTLAIVLLLSLRSVVRKRFTPRITKTNIDSIIGATGVVITPVNNIAALGQVQINGVEWSARSTDGSHIGAGTLVKVDKIEGVKVFVSLAQETPVA